MGAPRDQALQVGLAIELIHCYSLVHDDLPAMDNDNLRRGKPTCHVTFDEATAILTGDGLLTLAFEIISAEDTHQSPAVRCQLVGELARSAGIAGMIGGQILDLKAEEQGQQTLAEIISIQALKTGALFRFSVKSGGILGEASIDDMAALDLYAEKVGLAFQMADDILDVESSPQQLGKLTQKDAEAGKSTFIDLYGLDGAKTEAKKLIREANNALSSFGERADNLRNAALFVLERQK